MSHSEAISLLEASKQALETLKMCRGLIRNNIAEGVAISSPNPFFSADVDNAITTLRTAIAEAESRASEQAEKQEPVATVGSLNEYRARELVSRGFALTDPLYTTPPGGRQSEDCLSNVATPLAAQPAPEFGLTWERFNALEAEIATLQTEWQASLKEIERLKAAQPAPVQEPMNWREHVEQRIRTWRQRTMNKCGDMLAIDDFMGQDSIDDLVDFVCDEWAGPPAAQPAVPLTDALEIDKWHISGVTAQQAADELRRLYAEVDRLSYRLAYPDNFAREWVGLTRAECLQIEKDMLKYYNYQHECKTVCLPEFAKAIEAKLREKNGGAA